MSLTYEQANNEMLTLFKTAWDTTGYLAYYENTHLDRDDASEDPYARVFVRHLDGRQASLSGEVGTRRFRRSGQIIVQVYATIGKGLSTSYQLGKVVADAYEGSATPGGAWFRNVTIREVGRDGEFHRSDVNIEFEYDEVK